MNNRKLLIFASFLLLAGCTTDPDMDNNVGGGTSAQTPSAKIVNTSADAAAETLLVYFNDRAVESIESTAAATRTAATRSGVASVDDVLSSGDRFVGTSFHLRRPERRTDPRRRAA